MDLDYIWYFLHKKEYSHRYLKNEVKKMWKNIKRNENRVRRKSGRARTNALNSMTPQGQALWAARNVENSANENLIKAIEMSMTEVKK